MFLSPLTCFFSLLSHVLSLKSSMAKILIWYPDLRFWHSWCQWKALNELSILTGRMTSNSAGISHNYRSKCWKQPKLSIVISLPFDLRLSWFRFLWTHINEMNKTHSLLPIDSGLSTTAEATKFSHCSHLCFCSSDHSWMSPPLRLDSELIDESILTSFSHHYCRLAGNRARCHRHDGVGSFRSSEH